jgi:alpha-ketoglutarate-dependent taurine dioxygenase/4-hydroxybenzoate polyprenyltransferase
MKPAVVTERLTPFGLVVTVPDGTPFGALDPADVHAWTTENRVLVLRGVAPPEKRDLPAAARSLGPLLAFSFGSVNELRPEPDAKNYLYTSRAVPLHWDGAFLGEVPRYLFFHCVAAPEVAGGETVFVDTTRVWAGADEATRDVWRQLRFVYETDRLAHYGGRFEARVVAQHPFTHETVLRFAEPVDDLNPVTVTAQGLSPLESARMITELRRALGANDAVLAHAWRTGDIVVADNHALLHGRRAFAGGEKRHIRRVNVAGGERSWKTELRDALRIRRPEFMVAELPILLIPALLVAGRGSSSPFAVALFAELALLFFLLFHFGDMINCLADRDLDAVYKTRLSEAVHGLGVTNVRWQLGLTTVAALGLGAHLAWVTGRAAVLALVVSGLLLGAQYSVGPLRLKGRGVWQVVGLCAVIFFGPMALVAAALGAHVSWELAALVVSYGVMQQGLIVVNTAEDLPEDTEYGIRTTAVALGLRGAMVLAREMVGLGGLAVLALFGWMALRSGRSVVLVLGPLACAWAWVTWELAAAARAVRALPVAKAIERIRPRARRMPLWITATAWTSLWAAAWLGASWSTP